MSDKHYIGLDVTSFENTGKHKPVSRVTLFLDNENYYTAGDDTGKEIIANCPSATQAMADALWAKFKGYEHQSFNADAANIDPAAELGDGVTVGGFYATLSRVKDDGNGYAGIAAPDEPELEEEYPYTSPIQQEIKRQSTEIYSVISKTAEEISLEIVSLENAFSEMELTLEGYGVRIQDAEGNLAELELATEEFRVSINGLEGDYAELALTLDGLTVTDDEGTTRIKGSSIETDTLFVNAANISGTLKANQVNLTGAITWGDLATDAQSEITEAQTAASDAYDLAYDSYNLSEEALSDLELLANGQYQGGTFIDGTNIYAPNLYGDTITLLDTNSRVVGSMSLQYSSTYAFDLSSKLSLRMQSAAGYNAYLGNGYTEASGNVAGVLCSAAGTTRIFGGFVLTDAAYGYSLPTSGTTGQVFFLLE